MIPRSWPHQFGRALVVVAAAVLGAACAPADAEPEALAAADSEPTIGSEALSSEELAELTESSTLISTTSAAARQTEPSTLPVGAPLAPGATAEEIITAVEEVHGLTDDLSGQMNRFASFPAIPTPEAAYVTELRVDARSTFDDQWIIVVAEVTFDADGRPEELIDFYAEALASSGWSQTGRHGRGSLAAHAHRLSFEIPDTVYERDDFSVLVTDGVASSAANQRSEVRLRYVEQQPIDGDDTRQRFQDWAAGIPLPEGGVMTGAGIQTSSIGRHSLHFSLGLEYPDSDPATVAGSLRAALPNGDIQLLETPQYGDKLDHWVYLASPTFDDAWVSTHAPVGGPTVVNIDARSSFVPLPLQG